MNATRILTTILVVTVIVCIGGLAISCWTLHRMFAPHPRIVEDASSISADTRSRFFSLLDNRPARVVHVYECDTRGIRPGVLLRFTIPDLAEYDAFKRSIAGISPTEPVAAFPGISRRCASLVESWWKPPKAGIRKVGDHYMVFDDPNQTTYMSFWFDQRLSRRMRVCGNGLGSGGRSWQNAVIADDGWGLPIDEHPFSSLLCEIELVEIVGRVLRALGLRDNDLKMKSNGRSLYVVFLAGIAAVPAMATDMYLAAMPVIAKQWGVPDSRVALSLVLWFVSFSVFLLICGPLSDKHGRRPVLLAGLGLFTAATVACSLATNVVQLIAFRILQGIGAAGPSSMCMAICRDRYEGPQRKHILAWIGIILGLMPMIAPSIGAAMLRFANWRGIFVTQATLASIALLVSWRFYRETAAERVSGHIFALVGRYGRLAKNSRYLLTVTAMGLIIGPFYGFIAFAPIVYIQIYGLSSQAFGLLFGLNALMGMLGAFACTRIMRMISDNVLLTVCLVGCVAGGAGLLAWSGLHYLAFAACMCTVTFFCGMSRPLANHLILEQVRTDIGSASSFIVFYQFMVGAICMKIVTASWRHPLHVFGALALAMPAVVLAIWPFLLRMLKTPLDAVNTPDLAFDNGVQRTQTIDPAGENRTAYVRGDLRHGRQPNNQ